MLRDRLAPLLPRPIARVTPLSSGVGGSISRIEFADGGFAVAKAAPGDLDLSVEGRMLDLLRGAGLPTPRVLASAHDLLVMEHVEHDGHLTDKAQRHAADLLAALHTRVPLVAALGDQCTSADKPPEHNPPIRYGLHVDNTIGPLPQPNAWLDNWPAFFRERRLGPMLDCARRVGAVSPALAARVERLMARLPDLLPAHPRASLIHGDIWSGNVLAHQGRIAAFIDPAPYYAHAEVELAFITLFSTLGRPFFERYEQQLEAGTPTPSERAAQTSATPRLLHHAAAPPPTTTFHPADIFDPAGFATTRRALYNLYPLLVHCTLFGSGYSAQVASSLDALGF